MNLPILLKVVGKGKFLDNIKNLVDSSIVISDFIDFSHHCIRLKQQSINFVCVVFYLRVRLFSGQLFRFVVF